MAITTFKKSRWKRWEKKKLIISTFLADSRDSKTQRNIHENGSQQRGNRFSSTFSGVYEDFIKNFIRQYHHQQQQQENINQQQKQNINRIHIRGCFLKYIGIDLYWSHFLVMFQVFSLQLCQKRGSSTGVFLWIYSEHAFYRTPPDDCFWKNTRFH